MASFARTRSADAVALSDLVLSIYETVEAPELWPEVLSRIGAAMSASQTLLFVSDPAPPQAGTLACRDTPPELIQDFLAYYASVNVLAAPCDRMFAKGKPRFSHWAVPDAEFEQTEFYNDFFRGLDLFYSCGIKASLSTGGQAYLSLQRPKRATAFERQDGSLLETVLPHLQRALALGARAQTHAAARQSAEACLAAFGKTVFGVDASGNLRYASPAAEQMLLAGCVLYAKNGRLRARNLTADRELVKMVSSFLALDAEFRAGNRLALSIPTQEGDASLRLTLLPVRGDASGGGVRAVLLVSDPSQRYASRAQSMMELYGLTPTEARVADALLNRGSPAKIAEGFGISVDTTRFYIKRILMKTAQPRQAELVRLLMELPGDVEKSA